MIRKIAVILLVGFLGWAYQSAQPPLPKICGSLDGPPVTSTRIKLSDGRYLAYKESGVPREIAKYKIITVHGFDSSKDFTLPASRELVEELGIYFVSFDRAGYAESDPNPKRSVKSEALDIQELADQLELGSKFYVIGVSMGGYPVYACLKYIPHRLAGATLLVPIINYWWPSLPANLSKATFGTHFVSDQWMLRVAHYTPHLLYWWMSQKWIPSSALVERHPKIFSQQDKEIIGKMASKNQNPVKDKAQQQGVFESLYRDLMVGFGTWEFDPLDLNKPFPHNEGSVHLWQGYEDRLVSCTLQRYVAKRLPWIRYHEVPEGGHLFVFKDRVSDAILRELLLGEEPSTMSF